MSMLAGLMNLAMYSWGSHAPENLAVGIACLFIATFDMLGKVTRK
jgi:hypothetical protein